ncbi:MAG TPA: hypothetical protein VH143_08290 [Kofleriaceae bacterium]|nr:hypothetical protein [Kofleriaceae bacterium]
MTHEQILAGLRTRSLHVDVNTLPPAELAAEVDVSVRLSEERSRKVRAGERTIDVYREDKLVFRAVAKRDEARALIAAGARWVGHGVYAP